MYSQHYWIYFWQERTFIIDDVLIRMKSLLIIMSFASKSFLICVFPPSSLFRCLTVQGAGCQIHRAWIGPAFTSQGWVAPFSGKPIFSCFPQLPVLLGFAFVAGYSFSVSSVWPGSVLGFLVSTHSLVILSCLVLVHAGYKLMFSQIYAPSLDLSPSLRRVNYSSALPWVACLMSISKQTNKQTNKKVCSEIQPSSLPVMEWMSHKNIVNGIFLFFFFFFFLFLQI